jgi:hypothetical protein
VSAKWSEHNQAITEARRDEEAADGIGSGIGAGDPHGSFSAMPLAMAASERAKN